MIDRIIHFSIYNKLLIGIMVLGLMVWGTYSLVHLPIDAVPDITDNQVQIITNAPDLSAPEVERFITYPLELELGNVPDVEEIRSISRIGLSVITVVFKEEVDIYWARQQIHQKIQAAKADIPVEFGVPEMGPISTGLGEIYQYVIYPEEGYENQYTPTDLRTIQDWIIKRQLIGIPGVVEVNSSGGFLKQYEVAVDVNRLQAYQLSMTDIIDAIEKNNENTGGSYIERRNYIYFIRGEGMLADTDELAQVLVKHTTDGPILLKDVAEVKIGSAPRFGAVTMNGRGEVVAGQVMMLKGANSMEVVKLVKERMEQVKASLPKGVQVEPYLDRSKLINQTTHTVTKNLIEGALIVLFILVLFLGNWRAGLIVASVIPLSMLFAISLMSVFGVSANLMSLGAIDFGLIVDGAVIIVEAILYHLGVKRRNNNSFDARAEVYQAASRIRKSAAFGEIIILIVYLPILFLRGIEGKMFQPMAQTVSFAILGALILSLTYVPMMSAMFLQNSRENMRGIGHRIIRRLQILYEPLLRRVLQFKYIFLLIVTVIFGASIFTLSRMGGEFIPTLEEGDFALHQILPSGSSIRQGVEVSAKLQDILTEKFPEVEKVVTKIGTPEIPTDIMPMEAGDIYVIMKPKSEWISASSREEMFAKMEMEMEKFPGVIYEFTQPIQMRFNELMTGVRQDIAIKIYGENLGELYNIAKRAEQIIAGLPGAGDIQVERTGGLQYLDIQYDRKKLGYYGISVQEVSDVIKTAYAGRVAGTMYQGERKFDIVVRLDTALRQNSELLSGLMIPTDRGGFVPLSQLASISLEQGPAQISRDDTKRRITIGVNARNLDVATLIEQIIAALDQDLDLPPGYHIRFGGQFENLERARARLSLVVPIALMLIFVLLYLTFNSVKYALLIYAAIPLSAIGGIWALYLRGMPFSISAGVGFIALFGVAVLNGIVLVGYFNYLKNQGMLDIEQIIYEGTRVRLRPVLLTASVASLGFLPMALSTSAGAEVQRPLATVVIGGLITATILTLFVLPVLYKLVNQRTIPKMPASSILLILLLSLPGLMDGQNISLEEAVQKGLEHSNRLQVFQKRYESLLQQSEAPILPLPMTVGITGDEYQFGVGGVHAMYVGKSFRTGNYREASRNLIESRANLVLAESAVTEQLLAHTIAQEYLDVSLRTAQLALEIDHKQLVDDLEAKLDRLVEVGEIGQLPLQQARIRNRKLQLQVDQLSRILTQSQNAFMQWFDTNYEVFSLEQVIWSDSLTPEVHPAIASLQWEKEILSDQNTVLEATQKPTLQTQLSLQSVNSDIPFVGYQMGVSIPLGKQYVEQRKLSYQLQQEAVEEQEEYLQWYLDRTNRLALADADNFAVQSSTLAEVLIPDAEEMVSQYTRAFELGEASLNDIFLIQDELIALRHEFLLSRYQYLMKKIDAKYLIISDQ